MIGEIRKAFTPYYNATTKRVDIKSRPALLIAKADADDYVVLPVSRVSKQNNRHPDYDIQVDPAVYPELHLNAVSYVRTHKQTVIHKAEIGDMIGDMKGNYEELFLEILAKREEFSKEITDQAID